jgi:hypothetical protein
MRAFQRCSADSRRSIYAAMDPLLGAFEVVARRLPLDENQQLKQHPRRIFAESRRMATDRKRIAHGACIAVIILPPKADGARFWRPSFRIISNHSGKIYDNQ